MFFLRILPYFTVIVLMKKGIVLPQTILLLCHYYYTYRSIFLEQNSRGKIKICLDNMVVVLRKPLNLHAGVEVHCCYNK